MTSNFTAAELRAQARTIEHSGLPEFFRGCVYRALREYAALKEAADKGVTDEVVWKAHAAYDNAERADMRDDLTDYGPDYMRAALLAVLPLLALTNKETP